jgi:uncharacterized membrane protein (DUF2068 family)
MVANRLVGGCLFLWGGTILVLGLFTLNMGVDGTQLVQFGFAAILVFGGIHFFNKAKEQQIAKEYAAGEYKDGITTKKPRVIGLVGLGIVKGALGLIMGYNNLQLLAEMQQKEGFIVYDWVQPLLYATLAMAVLSLIAAIGIAQYRRWGLMLGLVAFGLDTVLGIGAILLGTVPNVIALVINVIALIYIYRYLNNPEESDFFT